MKKFFLVLVSALALLGTGAWAQEVKTHSVYDVNQSGTVTVEDVTTVVDKVKKNVAAAETQQYVTAEELSALFKAIQDELKLLKTIQSDLELLKSKMGITGGEVEDEGNKHNGHEYVDLGLSVKWADMNIGAEKPEDSGWYLAWGETKPKDVYDWSTYFDTNDGGNTFTKYTTSTKTTLDPEDDAAHVNWGGDWRMPTVAEQSELRSNCTWTWTTQNGVKGYKVTSKVNGNSIFLPAAGYRYYGDLYVAGSDGDYWSSSLYTSYSYSAFNLNFNSGGAGPLPFSRSFGQSVRAVCP